MAIMRESLLAAETASAATRTSASQTTPPNAKGIILRVKTASGASTPSFTPKIQRKAVIGSDVWEDYWTAAAAITTDTTSLYILYPAASGGNVVEVDGVPIPHEWRLVLTRNSGNADTEADFDFCW